MINFYQSIADSLKEEKEGAEKYKNLAKDAPTKEAREALMEIAKQEIMHHAKLECLLLDDHSADATWSAK